MFLWAQAKIKCVQFSTNVHIPPSLRRLDYSIAESFLATAHVCSQWGLSPHSLASLWPWALGRHLAEHHRGHGRYQGHTLSHQGPAWASQKQVSWVQ